MVPSYFVFQFQNVQKNWWVHTNQHQHCPQFKSWRVKNLFSLVRNLFLSHRFNSWMPNLLLNEDLEEIIQEGWHHEFYQWKKGKKRISRAIFFLSIYNVCSIIACCNWLIEYTKETIKRWSNFIKKLKADKKICISQRPLFVY